MRPNRSFDTDTQRLAPQLCTGAYGSRRMPLRADQPTLGNNRAKMSKIKTIGMDDLDRLGVDETNKLYWDGKPIVTEERIALALWVNVAVIVGSAAAALTALVEILKFFGFGHS